MYQEDASNDLIEGINFQMKNESSIVKMDLCFLEAPKPCGSNYIDVPQNSLEWQEIRKNTITASRLPSLLGLHGKSKYEEMWAIVKNGISESQNTLKNFVRGHLCESEAISNFELILKAKTERCGYFYYLKDKKYGSSPDALGPSSILLEVKTRAEGSMEPLQSLCNFPHYYVQCQLQMLCTETQFCLLQSYHPETQTSMFFLIKQNNTLVELIKQITDSIYDNTHILEWEYNEILELDNFKKDIIGKISSFELTKIYEST